jgi:putative photosynthetic complex assembly protein
MSTVRFEEDQLERELIPPVAIKATAVLLVLVVVLAAVARLTGVGALVDEAQETRVPLAERSLVFVPEGDDGPVRLLDGVTGALVRELPPGEGGFLRGVVRPLSRERMRAGADPEAPWVLTAWSDGALTLSDPETGMRVDLRAFGPTNADAFADLLASRTLADGASHP